MKLGLKFAKRAIAVLLIVVVVIVAGSEIWLWRSGYGDFPLYDTDDEIGYVPKPNQAGQFANQHVWYFNADSMRNHPFSGDAQADILLIGDSIVFGGGINYQPEQRLGACLQEEYRKGKVWAASAGSWAFLNELTYLERHPEVVSGVGRIIWVLNTGDLARRTQWTNSYTHPTDRPRLLCLYLAGKWWHSRGRGYWQSWLGSPPPEVPLAVERSIGEEARTRFLSMPSEIRAKSFFILYPDRKEHEQLCADAPPVHWQLIQEFLEEARVQWAPVPAKSFPADGFYDDGIHPTPQGNKILAVQLNVLMDSVFEAK
jgi:hypothetical protein